MAFPDVEATIERHHTSSDQNDGSQNLFLICPEYEKCCCDCQSNVLDSFMQNTKSLPLCADLKEPRIWSASGRRPPSSVPTTRYQYAPLERGQIRVLYVQFAKSFDSPIHCRIRHGNIHWTGAFDPYMTLSYCWGPVKDDGSHFSEVIKCDGKLMPVTAHLYKALQYIRLKERIITHDLFAENKLRKQVPVWIDAVCINQNDPIERAEQVRQMAQIYTNSSRLIIWLGVPEQAIPPDIQSKGFAECIKSLKRNKIFDNAWYSRRWIIEEYVLTPALSRFYLFGPILSIAIRSTERCINRVQGRLFEGAQCSVEHDVIYALLPLSHGSAEVADILIDYDQDFESLLLNVARSMLQHQDRRRERLIPILAIASAKRSSDHLPSWVPDWRSGSVYTCKDHELAVEGVLGWPNSSHTDWGSDFSQGLKAVARQHRKFQGRFLKPSDVPTYERPRGIIEWMRDAIDLWETHVSRNKMELEVIEEGRQALFMVPNSYLVLVLTKVQGSSTHVFQLTYCFESSRWTFEKMFPAFPKPGDLVIAAEQAFFDECNLIEVTLV